MKKEQNRFSIVDGTVEENPKKNDLIKKKHLLPIFEEVIVKILTLEGLEEKTQKRIVGFEEREHDE